MQSYHSLWQASDLASLRSVENHNVRWYLLPYIQGSTTDNMQDSRRESLSCSVLSDSATSVDRSPAGSSVHGILQARILEWVAILFSRDLPDPGIELGSPALQADSLLSEPPGKPDRKLKLARKNPKQKPVWSMKKCSPLVAILCNNNGNLCWWVLKSQSPSLRRCGKNTCP